MFKLMWINVEGQLLLMWKSKFSRLTGAVVLAFRNEANKHMYDQELREKGHGDAQWGYGGHLLRGTGMGLGYWRFRSGQF